MNRDTVLHAPVRRVMALVGLLALTACQTSPVGEDAASNAPEAAPQLASTAADAPASATTTGDIVASAAARDDLDVLVRVLEETGFADTLRGQGPYTLFAPNDAAFDDIPLGMVDTMLLPENRQRFLQILSFHVVPQKLSSTDLGGGTRSFPTLEGGPVSIVGSAGAIAVDRATIVTPDIAAANGVIHVIDRVLIPLVSTSDRGGAGRLTASLPGRH